MISNGHSPAGDSVNNTPSDLPGPSSSQPPTSSAYSSRSFHSHSNQPHSHTMTTLVSAAEASFAKDSPSSRAKQLSPHVALIPRSALQDGHGPCLENVYEASSLMDNQDLRRMNMDTPLGAQSSTSMEVTHDGKATGLVARFGPSIGSGYSDAAQGFHDDCVRASSMSTHRNSVLDAGTIRGPPSPRKPIPMQWLSTSSGPNLATAQRAKVRVHKKGSQSGSPVEVKTLRGTRSAVDISRSYGTDTATFLAKDALSTVENEITSPIAAHGPTKHQRPSSKPAWHSPGASPLHESPRHQPALTLRTSPSKKFLSNPDPGIMARRGTGSAATSTGESVFHSAEVSPVRSTADSQQSFQTSVETMEHDDLHITYVSLSTDSEDEQTTQKPGAFAKAATIGRGSSVRPKLSVDTSSVGMDIHANDNSSTSVCSATNSSTTSDSPWSATSACSISRIPRVTASSSTVSARGPTCSSTLKRTRSVKAQTSPKVRSPHTERPFSDRMLPPNTPTAASVRHVRTVNSSGRTPILTRRPTDERDPSLSTISSDPPADLPSAKETYDTLAQVTSTLQKLNVDLQHQLHYDTESKAEQSTRASSMCTVKATPAATDPVIVDSAIIYSKKSGASGTYRANNDSASIASDCTATGTHASSAQQETSKQVTPAASRRTRSTHLLQPHGASKLRATAPVFVPSLATKAIPEIQEATPIPAGDPMVDLLGDQKFELDMYGIPWFYYMNQVQFAYNQGFYNGRAKSPKKLSGRRKHRSSVNSPPDAQFSHTANGPAPALTARPDQHRASEMPPPDSTVPSAEKRAQQKQDASIEGENIESDRPFSPFAAQKDIIARQAGLHDTTNTPRGPKLDLTTIRNVPAITGPRNIAPAGYHNAVPSRGHFNNRRNYNRSDNGLYSFTGGRGMTGVPIHDTIPFPNPVPPQGRPIGEFNENPRSNATHVPDYRTFVGSEACGMVHIVRAAERVGGEACNECEPDHPLE